MARASKRSEPGAVRRMLLELRPTISDLFTGYGIAGDEASRLLREAVQVLILQCERTEDPRHFFLVTLEELCRASVEAQEAEEEADGGTPGA